MGKKGTWLSAIKTLFTSHKKNQLNEADKKTYNKGRRRSKHGSFIPFCREPSSIEDILGEVDQHNLFAPTTQSQSKSQPQQQPQPDPQPQSQLQPPPQPQSQQPSQPQSQPPPPPPQPQSQSQPKQQPQPHSQPQPTSSSGRPVSPTQRLTSPPRIASLPRVVHQQPKISHRPEPSLQQRHLSATRIQAVYRGYRARRKVRGLTGLVRLQRVVTSPNVKRQTVNTMKQMQLLVRVQTQIRSQRIQNLKNQALKPQPKSNKPHKQDIILHQLAWPFIPDEDWDDSVLTKEEREARLQRKEEALIKRERAMAYAYSHQSWKGAQTPAHQTLWWNWLERQLPYHTPPLLKNHQHAATPSRPTTPRTHKQLDTPTTPTSSKSMTPTSRLTKYSKARTGASFYSTKDDDSLMSCPPFSVPNYMSPTVSARAKARPASNPKERSATPSTPGSVSSNRRFSFPFTPNTNNKHKSPGSIGDLSMDSMPASVGRKPFNRFV